jgi:hypothetical protein
MNKWSKLYIAFALLVWCSGSAFAQNQSNIAQIAVIKMANEMIECAAYFDIVSLALLNSNAPDMAQKYIRSRKLAVGRANSLSPGVANARYNMFIRDMTNKIIISNITKSIDKDLSNVLITDISVLHNQYAKICKEVMDSPGERAKYWKKQTAGASR